MFKESLINFMLSSVPLALASWLALNSTATAAEGVKGKQKQLAMPPRLFEKASSEEITHADATVWTSTAVL